MTLVLETLIWKMTVVVSFSWMRYLMLGHYFSELFWTFEMLDLFDCLELHSGDLDNGFAFRDSDLGKMLIYCFGNVAN